MGKVLLAGDICQNNGPSNVNKEFYKYLRRDIKFIKAPSNTLLFAFQLCIFTLLSQTIIYSGILKADKISLRIATAMRKKIIYIMHGCVSYEQGEVNETDTLGGDVLEDKLFRSANLILCVSQPFAKWFCNYRPEFSEKVDVLTNGISWEQITCIEDTKRQYKKNNSVILLGGGRKTKANLSVVKAIDLLNREENMNLKVNLYGYSREDDDSSTISEFQFVTFCGMIPHRELMTQFESSLLFVQNSIFEPFGLACVEAISHGCDILLSKYVGCGSIIKTQEQDIINNPYDIAEIAYKIKEILKKKNSNRLLNSIDKESTSCETSAKRLLDYVKHI